MAKSLCAASVAGPPMPDATESGERGAERGG